MMIDDPRLALEEERWVIGELTAAGVSLPELPDAQRRARMAASGVRLSPFRALHSKARQTEASREVLAASYPRLRSVGAAFSIIDALGRHDLTDEHVRHLVAFGRRLAGMSHDEHLQYCKLRALRRAGNVDDERERAKTLRLLDQAYYLSHTPPPGPRKMHVDHAAYPGEVDQRRFREDFLKNLVFNVLSWHARASLFEDLVELIRDVSQGHVRFVLCEALRKASAQRAIPQLMELLSDPDIGAHAMP